MKSYFKASIFVIIFSCKSGIENNVEDKISTINLAAGTPELKKEKVSPKLYNATLDKVVKILDDIIKIPDVSSEDRQRYDEAKENFNIQIKELKKQDSAKNKQVVIKYSGKILQNYWLANEKIH